MHDHPAKAPTNKAKIFSPQFARGLGELAPDYDVLLCDVWGVVHNGIAYFEKAIDALIRFRDKGGLVILITNAPRPKAKIVRMLDRLAVPHDAYDGVVTSGDVTAALIVARGSEPLAHIGPELDESVFVEAEHIGGRPIPRVAIEAASYVVCTGLVDAKHEAPADYHARLALMKDRSLDFICANPDIVVELGKSLYYCAGALAELYAAMGGEVIHAGKPHLPIYERALALAAGVRGAAVDRRRVLAIGDGINTDIKGGANQGIDTLFVTSGIHRPDLQGDAATIDVAALQRLFESHGVVAKAVLSELVW
ncbi:MAG: TIGR01459 family HAD-type hydrolase [Beijerinckiaceae bacterium]